MLAARKPHFAVARLLTPVEVAELFEVNPLTVTRWAVQGRIGSVRTLGGTKQPRRRDHPAGIRADGRLPISARLVSSVQIRWRSQTTATPPYSLLPLDSNQKPSNLILTRCHRLMCPG